MKKLLILLVSLLVLVGCGSGSLGSADNPKLVFYTIGSQKEDSDRVNDAVNEYLDDIEAGFNVLVEYVSRSDYDETMSEINNSRTYYDFAYSNSSTHFVQEAKNGAFLDISDLIEEHAPETLKQIGGKETLEVARVDEGIYAIPSGLKASNQQILFDANLVEAYGVPYQEIKSLESLSVWYDQLAQQEIDYDMLQINRGFTVPNDYDEITWPLAVHYEDQDLKVVNVFEMEDYQAQLAIMNNFYERGFINQDAAVLSDAKDRRFFTSVANGGPNAAGYWTEKHLQPIVTSAFVEQPFATSRATQSSMLTVSSKTKHPEKVLQFIELLNTDEKLQNMLAYGLEGEHYMLDEHGRIMEAPGSENYSGPINASLGTGKVRALRDYDALDSKEIEENYEATLRKSVLFGFSFDPTDLEEELEQIALVRDEYKAILSTGSVAAESYIPQMLEKLEAAGLPKVLEAVENQLAAWKK